MATSAGIHCEHSTEFQNAARCIRGTPPLQQHTRAHQMMNARKHTAADGFIAPTESRRVIDWSYQSCLFRAEVRSYLLLPATHMQHCVDERESEGLKDLRNFLPRGPIAHRNRSH